MPTVAKLGKYRLFFFSNEGTEPPHVHVESGDAYAKFWLEPVTLDRSIGYNASELTRIRKLVLEHRERVMERWHEHFG
jgi:hypothetical protein